MNSSEYQYPFLICKYISVHSKLLFRSNTLKRLDSYLIILFLMVLFALPTNASSYYFSPAGNNTDGLTPNTAFTSINKLDSVSILPGDKILFEGGKTFEGSIKLDAGDANNPSNPILISSFGNGKAIINTSKTDDCGLIATNTQGIEIRNIVFKGPGDDATHKDKDGILFYTTLPEGHLSNIVIKNVEVCNYGYCGIRFYSSWDKNIKSGFNRVKIDSCEVYNCKENGIVSLAYDEQNLKTYHHSNFKITNTKIHDITGYPAKTHKGSGIVLSQIDSCLIERCEAYNNGTRNVSCGGPGGIWVYSANNTVIQYCESHHNSAGTGCDGLGFDLDGGCTNTTLQYNYSHDNDGAGYLLCQYDFARPWSNNVVKYNISENDSRTNHSPITFFNSKQSYFNGVKVFNNTIYVSKSDKNKTPQHAAMQISKWESVIENVELYNNIFVTDGNLELIDIPEGFNIAMAGNLYWASNKPTRFLYHGKTLTSLDSLRMAASSIENLGNKKMGIVADPKLKDMGKSIHLFPNQNRDLSAYRIDSSSPAWKNGIDISKQINVSVGLNDYYQNDLTNNNTHSIGACETIGTYINSESRKSTRKR